MWVRLLPSPAKGGKRGPFGVHDAGDRRLGVLQRSKEFEKFFIKKAADPQNGGFRNPVLGVSSASHRLGQVRSLRAPSFLRTGCPPSEPNGHVPPGHWTILCARIIVLSIIRCDGVCLDCALRDPRLSLAGRLGIGPRGGSETIRRPRYRGRAVANSY